MNKIVNASRVPSEGVNTWLKGLIDLVNTILQEWLLYREKS